MKKFISNNIFLYSIGVILLLGIWWLVSITLDVSNMIIPTPWNTFKESFVLLGNSYTFKCIGFTLLRVLVSFVISFVLALVLGIIAGNSKTVSTVFKPSVVTLKCIPTAALVFLFIILSGAKNASILVTILVSFPILYEAITNGIQSVDQDVIDAAKIDGTNLLRRNLHIYLPIATPYIIVGVLSSFSLSFKVEIMSEVITGSTSYGIGSAIKGAINEDPTSMVKVFAYSLISVIIVAIITLLAHLVKNSLKDRVPGIEKTRIL